MTPEQFAYWLQGFAELNQQPPTAEQWQSIRDHLATVFKKVTPPVLGPAVAGLGLDAAKQGFLRQCQPAKIDAIC